MATEPKTGVDALAAPAPPKGQQYQLAAYADRNQVREAMERFKAGLRIKDASEHEYAALAHVALKYDLDPFNGETWIIPGRGVTMGIKGLRKMANRQARERNIRWWTEFFDVRNDDEAAKYGVPTSNIAVAKICVLRRSDLIEAYVETLKSIREIAGEMPFDQLQAILGRPPVFTGVGYVLQGEKSVMPLGQLAMKRAETHAIRQAFDVDYLVDENEPDTAIAIEKPNPSLAEGDMPDVEEGELVGQEKVENLREAAARISEAMYGGDDPDLGAEKPHWIDNSKARTKFWLYTKNDLGLDKDEVYDALGVKSIHDYPGTMQEAKDKLDLYADAKSSKPKPTQPETPEPPPWNEGHTEPLFPDADADEAEAA